MAYDVGGRGDQSFNDSAAAGLDKAKTELGVEVKEARRRQRRDRGAQRGAPAAARRRAATTRSSWPGFAYAESVGKAAKDNPDAHFAIVDDASQLRGPERRPIYLRREAGLVPGRRGRRAEVQDRQHRLHRWRQHRPDQEVRGGLHRRRQGRQPRHQGRHKYLTQPPDFSRLQRPGQGQDRRRGHVRRRRRRRLPRRRRLRRRRLRGGQGRGQDGHRRRLRPVPHGRPPTSRTSS